MRSAAQSASRNMTTSDATLFPQRLTKIDELTRGDHTFLDQSDECLFFGDYSARKGFSHSATNSLIANFKRPVKYKGTPSWQYKIRDINAAAHAFSQNLGSAFSKITLVPIPPSKLENDPEYDDRMITVLRAMRAPAGISAELPHAINCDAIENDGLRYAQPASRRYFTVIAKPLRSTLTCRPICLPVSVSRAPFSFCSTMTCPPAPTATPPPTAT
jgi:hypothetical protein